MASNSNYYEYLGVPQNAADEVIRAALERLIADSRSKLGNPMTMESARRVLNEIVPGIEQHLLSGPAMRVAYDHELDEAKQRQMRRTEPADNEGLDEMLRTPFFFDPLDGYDTEAPALSLRQIAFKMDEEWAIARTWITSTENDVHPFISFLEHVAGRQRLAEHFEQIIRNARGADKAALNTNIALEQCIVILNPQVERPTVSIENASFDGKIFYAGEFIPDLPARSELMLRHNGIRGCVFGYVESKTPWLTFPGGQTTASFTLMPEDIDPAICASQVNIPLIFQFANLQHNSEHMAQLMLTLNNHEPPQTIPVTVHAIVLPLPPRVSFTPVATQTDPIWAGITRQGIPTGVTITPHNRGDNDLVPLFGRITSRDPRASAQPARFHNEEPITLHIDTTNRPFGQKYEVVFDVDYGGTRGASGPTALYVQGAILPTPRQSFAREKTWGERLGFGLLGSFLGFTLGGIDGVALSGHTAITWLCFLALPLIFPLLARRSAETIIAHIQRSGEPNISLERISNRLLLGIPIGIALLLSLLCVIITAPGATFLLAGLVGLAVGGAFGFIVDKAPASKQAPVPKQMPPMQQHQ